MDDRIPIASAVAGQSSAASANGIGAGIAACRIRTGWRGWVAHLIGRVSRRETKGGAARDVKPVAVQCAEDPARRFDALENELREALDHASADMTAFLDDWLGRLAAVPADVLPERRIRLLIDGGSQYYMDGAQIARSTEPLAQAIQLARHIGDQPQLRRGLSIQGVLRSSLRDAAGALQSLGEALELATSLNHPHGIAAAWQNLALVFVEARLHAVARVCYLRAERATMEVTDPVTAALLRSRILHGIALCQRADGAWAQAAATCELALQQVARPDSREFAQIRALVEGTYAFVLLELGRLEEAEAHARSSADMAQRSGSVRAKVTARTATGLVAVYQGRLEEGVAQILALREQSKAIYGSYDDTLRALVKAHERAGQEDRALEYMQELLELNRRARSVQLLKPFEDLHRSLHLSADSAATNDTAEVAKATELRSAVDERLSDLLNTCITNATRSGYDEYRVFRVGALTEQFAVAEGIEPERARAFGFAARLCDLGLMVIPDELLSKPRGLSAGEQKIMHEHTLFGAEVLTRARLAVLQPCAAVARFHHEAWNGSGPWGLRGEDIPVEARMTALADVFDSLTHARPWRGAKSVPAALRIISEERGARFDPALAERFVAFVQREYWRHDDWDAHLAAEAQDNAYIKARAQIDRLIKSGA